MHRLIPMLVRSPLTRVYFETLRMCWVSRVILAPADNSLGGAPMSPIRGAEEGYKGLGRSVRLNVDVAESSESDWDCGSNDAEGGEVLVRSSVSDSFCCENSFGGADVQPSTFFVFLHVSSQVKECALLLQRLSASNQILQASVFAFRIILCCVAAAVVVKACVVMWTRCGGLLLCFIFIQDAALERCVTTWLKQLQQV